MNEIVAGIQEMSDRLYVVVMLDYTYACREEKVGRMLEKMWK